MVNYKDVQQAQTNAYNIFKTFANEVKEIVGAGYNVATNCNGFIVIRSMKELSEEMLESLEDKGLYLQDICDNYDEYPFNYVFKGRGMENYVDRL